MFKIRIFMNKYEQLFLLFDGSENQSYDMVKILYCIGVSKNIHDKNLVFKKVQNPYWSFEQQIPLFFPKKYKISISTDHINITQISVFYTFDFVSINCF